MCFLNTPKRIASLEYKVSPKSSCLVKRILHNEILQRKFVLNYWFMQPIKLLLLLSLQIQ